MIELDVIAATTMRATWEPIGGELPTPLGLPHTALHRRDGILLRIAGGDGCTGVGEASPLPGYSSDRLPEVAAALAAWTATLPGASLACPADAERLSADLQAPSARFAAETALLCLLAARTRVPLHRLLGGDAAAGRAIPVRWLVAPDDSCLARVAILHGLGVRHVKLKVGADLAVESALLRDLHAAFPDVAIQLDANGSLPVEAAAALCREWAGSGVELIEEPVTRECLDTIGPLALPVALDESLQGADWRERLTAVAGAQRLAAVVLKPTALGGFARCRAVADEAARLGAMPIVTHTFDGPVAMAAAAELALSLPACDAAGLAPHPALAAYPRWSGAAITDIAIRAHDRPGIGLVGDGDAPC